MVGGKYLHAGREEVQGLHDAGTHPHGAKLSLVLLAVQQ